MACAPCLSWGMSDLDLTSSVSSSLQDEGGLEQGSPLPQSFTEVDREGRSKVPTFALRFQEESQGSHLHSLGNAPRVAGREDLPKQVLLLEWDDGPVRSSVQSAAATIARIISVETR